MADRNERWTELVRGGTPGPLSALWRHFPGDDLDPERLARAHADFYRRFPFDFLKVTWTAGSLGQAWGYRCELSRVDAYGVYGDGPPVVQRAAQWADLEPAAVDRGFLGDQLDVLARLRRELGEHVPLVATVFSPMTVAATLSGAKVYAHLAEDPAATRAGLAAVTATIAAFARKAGEAGADGIFYATSSASGRVLGPERFRAFARPLDLEVIAASQLPTILHLHGEDPLFAEVADYPVLAVNWHDRRVGPSLADMRRLTDRVLAGGVNDQGVIGSGDPREVAAEVEDALRQVPDGRLIVAPGCVIPVDSAAANLDAVIATVRRAREG